MKKTPRKPTNTDIWKKIQSIPEEKFLVYIFRAIAELFRSNKFIRQRSHAQDLLQSKYEWRIQQFEERLEALEQGTAQNQIVEEVELDSQWIVNPDDWSSEMHKAFYDGADPDPLRQLIE